jgi:DNA repair photolyase
LSRRIPLQFGGMTDPFSSFELGSSSTFDLLNVLADQGYPTLISTKGNILAKKRYLEILQRGNFLVRFSLSVIASDKREKIEKGTPSPAELFQAIETLSSFKMNCAVRLQPVIPGYELAAF